MTASIDRRVRRWLSVVGQLITPGMTGFPYEPVLQQMRATFACDAASWNWANPLDFGFEVDSDFGPVPPDLWELWNSGEFLRRNGLIRWFTATADPLPQTPRQGASDA